MKVAESSPARGRPRQPRSVTHLKKEKEKSEENCPIEASVVCTEYNPSRPERLIEATGR